MMTHHRPGATHAREERTVLYVQNRIRGELFCPGSFRWTPAAEAISSLHTEERWYIIYLSHQRGKARKKKFKLYRRRRSSFLSENVILHDHQPASQPASWMKFTRRRCSRGSEEIIPANRDKFSRLPAITCIVFTEGVLLGVALTKPSFVLQF